MNNHQLMEEAAEIFEHYCGKLDLAAWNEVGMLWGADGVWGSAHWEKDGSEEETYIELCFQLFRRHPEELPETIAHELVHIYLSENGRPNGHTDQFRQKMNELGFVGNATKRSHNNKPVVGIGR